jgi:polyisoprenoid-binding protein YceI
MIRKINFGRRAMKRMLIAPIILFITAGAGAQNTKTFHVNDETKRDIVTFTSKAPLETIVGKTGEVLGFITVDPGDIMGSTEGRIEVDLASLKTGIGLRDSHMREQYLETDKFPKTVFEITRVIETTQNTLEDRKPVELKLEGIFSVHGVKRQIVVPVTVTFIKESEATGARHPGDLLHIVGTFDILLSDYDIKRPQFVILKLDDKQKINIDIFAATGLPAVDLAQK